MPPTNLYYLCINRIHSLKHGGPFHEHSPQLYSIATGVTLQAGGWRKVNTGMMKMYIAEVLSKRVVVQHTPLGGILSWDEVRTEDLASRMQTPARLNGSSSMASGGRSHQLGAMGPPAATVAPGRITSSGLPPLASRATSGTIPSTILPSVYTPMPRPPT